VSSMPPTEATDAIAPASNDEQYRWLTELIFDPTFRTRFMNKSAGIEGRERR